MNFFMQDNNQQHEHVYFVNQLYRDFLLPTILGKDN
ncbi:MAG: YslB family protein, partial [Lactobacillus sp.]|nr:YslB family protein [Lactobacillus sp.]